MIDEHFVEDEVAVINSNVAEYTIRRSISSPYLFTVVALDNQRQPLFVVESDVTFEQAQVITEEFNNPTV